MEALQKSIDDMSKLFTIRMAEFQKDLDSSAPGVESTKLSPVTKISQDFTNFKNFIMFAVKNLQDQVHTLSRQIDDVEMRSRRKILLFHKLPEQGNEDIAAGIHKIFAERLDIAHDSPDYIVRCHRMGQFNEKKPRPILVEFKDISVRDNVWYRKTKLKGSGMTISEFLTKARHDVFVKARERFGISKSWTRSGKIYIIGLDGSRHCVVSSDDLDAIPDTAVTPSLSTASASAQLKSGMSNKSPVATSSVRPRRPTKQK